MPGGVGRVLEQPRHDQEVAGDDPQGRVDVVIDQPRGLALEVRPGLVRPPQRQRLGDDPGGADGAGQDDRGIAEPGLVALALVDIVDRAARGDEGAEAGRRLDRAAALKSASTSETPRCARSSTGMVDLSSSRSGS